MPYDEVETKGFVGYDEAVGAEAGAGGVDDEEEEGALGSCCRRKVSNSRCTPCGSCFGLFKSIFAPLSTLLPSSIRCVPYSMMEVVHQTSKSTSFRV